MCGKIVVKMANIGFRVPYLRRYLVLGLIGFVGGCMVGLVGLHGKVWVTLTVTVRVSRVSVMVSVRDNIK